MIAISIFNNFKPYQKLLLLLLVFVGFFIIVPITLMLLGVVIWGRDVLLTTGADDRPLSYLIFFQFSTQILVFAGSALFFALIVSKKPLSFLKVNTRTNFRFLLFSSIAMVLVIPLSGWLQQICLDASYPVSWQPAIDALKQQEEVSNNLMMRFLNVEGLSWLLFNVLFLAVVPAVCEELLFRGALIGVLRQIFKNKHVVVLISAVIFSAIHFQFFSFFSRLVLGLVLGYLFVFSGSILPSIIAHFTNNALSVIAFYFSNRTSLNDVGTMDNLWIVAVSTIAAVATLIWLNKHSDRHDNTTI